MTLEMIYFQHFGTDSFMCWPALRKKYNKAQLNRFQTIPCIAVTEEFFIRQMPLRYSNTSSSWDFAPNTSYRVDLQSLITLILCAREILRKEEVDLISKTIRWKAIGSAETKRGAFGEAEIRQCKAKDFTIQVKNSLLLSFKRALKRMKDDEVTSKAKACSAVHAARYFRWYQL